MNALSHGLEIRIMGLALWLAPSIVHYFRPDESRDSTNKLAQIGERMFMPTLNAIPLNRSIIPTLLTLDVARDE